jgi:hypothetical protein
MPFASAHTGLLAALGQRVHARERLAAYRRAQELQGLAGMKIKALNGSTTDNGTQMLEPKRSLLW